VDHLTTRDGLELSVRPIAPDDKQALSDAFERLSPESRYRRFLGPVSGLSADDLRYLTEVDHRDHEALIALGPGGEIVGVARLIRLPERWSAAEAAVTVADAWQGRGIGTQLLARLARRGRKQGIELFTGTCLADNHEIQRLFEELGPHMRRRSEGAGVVEFEVELPTAHEHPGLWTTLRAAAAGRLRPRPPESAGP
jgi:GNAT superfamily N-acetyltransferase